MSVAEKQKQQSIDEILQNIKNTIESKSEQSITAKTSEDILELVNVVEESCSRGTDIKSNKSIARLGTDTRQHPPEFSMSDIEVKKAFKEVLKPYLKSWLNKNMHKVAKEVMEKEVSLMLKKLKSAH